MPRYYNIHTHLLDDEEGQSLSIESVYNNFEPVVTGGNYCSIGLHPWHLEHAVQAFDVISRLAVERNVLAIGECGLDKVCSTPWQLQLDAFVWQVGLANKVGKPLIIHCVRAYNELLEVFKLHPPTVPVIIHGYNRNAAIAAGLLANGYYLSFGKALVNAGEGLTDAFRDTGGGSFFLETDDAGISIKDIYKKAAEIRKTSEEAIILQVRENFKNVFGI
jgi:TatD DNase family protein